MKANIGWPDRAVRIAAGLGLIILALAGAIGGWGWFGLYLLVTAAIGFCPIYRVVSYNTVADSA